MEDRNVKLYRYGVITWCEYVMTLAGEECSFTPERESQLLTDAISITENRLGSYKQYVEIRGGLKRYLTELAENTNSPTLPLELKMLATIV